MRISDWSSDVCSSDLAQAAQRRFQPCGRISRNFRSKRRIVRKSGMKRIEIVRYGIEQFGFCVLRNRGKQIKCFGYRLVIGISEGEIIRDEPQLVDSRSEEHTSELQSLMRISYAVFCLTKKKQQLKTKMT